MLLVFSVQIFATTHQDAQVVSGDRIVVQRPDLDQGQIRKLMGNRMFLRYPYGSARQLLYQDMKFQQWNLEQWAGVLTAIPITQVAAYFIVPPRTKDESSNQLLFTTMSLGLYLGPYLSGTKSGFPELHDHFFLNKTRIEKNSSQNTWIVTPPSESECRDYLLLELKDSMVKQLGVRYEFIASESIMARYNPSVNYRERFKTDAERYYNGTFESLMWASAPYTYDPYAFRGAISVFGAAALLRFFMDKPVNDRLLLEAEYSNKDYFKEIEFRKSESWGWGGAHWIQALSGITGYVLNHDYVSLGVGLCGFFALFDDAYKNHSDAQ